MEWCSEKKGLCSRIVKVVALSFLLFIPLSSCNPTGAPSTACSTLTPNHGIQEQQDSTFPYVIDIEVFRDPSNDRLLYTAGVTYNSKRVLVIIVSLC